MRDIKGSFKISFAGSLLVAFLALGQMAAKAQYASMGISEVVSVASGLLNTGKYEDAIPALIEVINRTREPDPASPNYEVMREFCQTARFELGRVYYRLGNSEEGLKVLEAYLTGEPRKKEVLAMRLVAQSLFDLGRWEEIEPVMQRMLKLPNLKREDRAMANMFLGQSRYMLKKWAEAVEPLEYAGRNVENREHRQVLQIMLVRCLVESQNWPKLFVWVPRLYRTDAKYDITLNITLMNAGKARFEDEDYLNALLLYRMVLPREKLTAFQKKRVVKLQHSLDRDIERNMVDEYEQRIRTEQIEGIKKAMKELADLPPYEDEVSFRIGSIYGEVKRYWEGYVVFEHMYNTQPESELGRLSLYKAVLMLTKVKRMDLAEDRIIAYLEKDINAEFTRELLSLLMHEYLDNKNWEGLVGLRRYVDMFAEPEIQDHKELQGGFHFMLAFAYFMRRDYANAASQFSFVVEKYHTNAQMMADARYYRGMAYLMQGDYANGEIDFATYQQDFAGYEYEAAALFREGVCLFGQQKIDEAFECANTYIEEYPTEPLVSEAYAMRGDIYGASEDENGLDMAIDDYMQAFDLARDDLQASYAVYQAAKTYQLEAKHQQIIDLMMMYIDKYGDTGSDIAEAYYWIGQSLLRMKLLPEALDQYLDGILRFGNLPEQAGVDKVIEELYSVYQYNITDDERRMLEERIYEELEGASEDAEVLRIRLKALITMLTEGEDGLHEYAQKLYDQGIDVDLLTPLMLAEICDIARESEDYERCYELYDYFLKNYEDAEKLWKAYQAKLAALVHDEKYEEALLLITDAQNTFGAEPYMSWGQLTKARIFMMQGDLDRAFDEYNAILGVSAWRGPTFAEANFNLAEIHFKRGEFKHAFQLFQRCYLVFKAHDGGKWAADGYLRSIDCLKEIGGPDEEEQIVNTLKAMLEDEYVEGLPQVEKARDMLMEYGG